MSRLYTPGRLFARAYSDLAQELAIETISDPEGISYDKSYSWFVLGLLSHRASPALQVFLENVIKEDDDQRASAVNSVLSVRALDSRTRTLLRERAKEGDQSAFDTLAQVYDPKTKSLFKEMTSWNTHLPYPKGRIPEEAATGLKRFSIIRSNDWDRKLKTIILGKSGDRWESDLGWAICVAIRRDMPRYKEVLKQRLDIYRKMDIDERWGMAYGNILVAYAEAGGAVTNRESHILEQLGYVGDPEKSLLDLVSKWPDPELQRVPWPRTSPAKQPRRKPSSQTLTKGAIDRILTPNLSAVPGLKERLWLGGSDVWASVFLEALEPGGHKVYQTLTNKDLAVLAREAVGNARNNPEGLVQIIIAVGNRRLKEAEPSLLAHRISDSALVRSALATTLIKLAGHKALETAEPFLRDPAIGVRKAAVSTLGRERVRGAGVRLAKMTSQTDLERELCYAFSSLQAPEGIPFLEKLVRERHRPGSGSSSAERALSSMAGPEHIPVFRDLLRWMRRDPAVGDVALQFLGRWGDAESIPIIEKAIFDHNLWGNTPREAPKALYLMGSRTSRDALLKLRRETHRTDALRILGMMGDREAIPEIRKFLDPPQYDAMVALGELGDQESIPAFRKLLGHEKIGVRRGAAIALALLNDHESLERVSQLGEEGDTARLIWPALNGPKPVDTAVIGSDKREPYYGGTTYFPQMWSGDGQRFARYLSLRARATAMAQVDVEPLRERLRKPDRSGVRLAAAAALVRMGHRDGLDSLLQARCYPFGLNVLRSPELVAALDTKKLDLNLYASYKTLHEAIADAAGLTLEGPEVGSDSHRMWKSVHHRFRKWGKPPTAAEALEMIQTFHWSVVLEEEAIRIMPRDEAGTFWKAWAESTK